MPVTSSNYSKVSDISYRPNALIDNCIKLPQKANYAFDIVLSVLNNEPSNVEANRDYVIDIEAIVNLLNTNDEKKYIYKMVREGFSYLRNQNVFIKIDETGGAYRILKDYRWIRKTKSISFHLNPEVMDFLSKEKGCAYFRLRYTLSLRGKYSDRLYYQLKRWEHKGYNYNTIEDLKEKVGFTGENKAFRVIMSKTVDEINAKTDIDVKLKPEIRWKDGKNRLTNINCEIRNKKKSEPINEEVEHIKDAIALIYAKQKVNLLRIAEAAYSRGLSAEEATRIASYTLSREKNKKEKDPIINLTSYACKCMTSVDLNDLTTTGKEKEIRFSNFDERNYGGFDEIEEDLLNKPVSKKRSKP